MKKKHLVLFMAFIMCFSLVFGAAAATEGEQVVPSTSAVSPTQEKDFIEKLPEMIPDELQTTLSEVGSDIMDGAEEAHGFLATVMRVIENIRIFFANLINTIFPFFGIEDGGSLLG